ncbi:hypothetical protein SNEBB_005973, partial [Seison nebaliae]
MMHPNHGVEEIDNDLSHEEAVMVEGRKRKIIPDGREKLPEEQDVVEGHDPKGNGPNLDPTDLPEYQSEDEFDFDGEKLPEEQDVVDYSLLYKVRGHDPDPIVRKKQIEMEDSLFLPNGKNISRNVLKKRRSLKTHHACVNSVAHAKRCPSCEKNHLPIHQCWQAYNRKFTTLQIQNPNYVKPEYNRKEEFFAEQLAIYMEEDQHLNRVLQEVANIGEEKVIRPINDPR